MNIMKLLSHPIILSVFLLCFCAGAFFIGHAALSYATFQSAENFCILLDAGHGGNDPGKVSSSGVKEKDINLAITLKLSLIHIYAVIFPVHHGLPDSVLRLRFEGQEFGK